MKACSFLQRKREQDWRQAISLEASEGCQWGLPTLLAGLGCCPGCPPGPWGPAETWVLPVGWVLPVPCLPLTCSLYSLRLRMTAVICWSMKMRMVTRTAGTADTKQTHHGLAPNGKTIQPRAGFVGCGEQKGHCSCHPPVGSVAQPGDRASPRCPG